MAAECGYTMGCHGGGAVWLPSQEHRRPWCGDASNGVQGHRQRGGLFMCGAALIFEGSILVYNPARDEAEWVPTHGVANDLSWAEERTMVALANFVPCIPQEADHIVELGTRCLLGWSTDSSSEEEDDQMQEEDVKPEGDEPEGDEHEEVEGWGEANPKLPSSGTVRGQSETELEIEP